jgi:uncharacterized membrane protein
MLWNAWLATIPLLLAARLFRHPAPERVGRPGWWLGVAAFISVLPNAPYVLTDLLHLFDRHATGASHWQLTFTFVPMLVALCAAGWGSYVVSLLWLTRFARRRGWSGGRVAALELSAHAACAAGVYLGRFQRFNSWELVTNPAGLARDTAYTFTQSFPLFATLVFFLATCMLYWPSRHMVIALVAYVRSGSHRHAGRLAEQWL